jgi:hypothetical protein
MSGRRLAPVGLLGSLPGQAFEVVDTRSRLHPGA